jgi:uncharacterized membrane protein
MSVKMRLRMTLWICLVSFLVWVLPAQAISYKYITIDYPGEPGNTLYGINSSGTEMVGFHFPLRGFKTDGKVFTPVAVPSYVNTVALGINTAGKIVGFCSPGGTIYHGYVKTGDDFSVFDVPAPETTSTVANNINDSDQIVGSYYTPSLHGYVKTGDTFYYFDYPNSTETECRGINNKGQVVGQYRDAGGIHGYVHDITNNTYTTIDYPGAGGTIITGINDLGQMVGYYYDGRARPQPLVYFGGSITVLQIPGAVLGTVHDIDNHGNLVGSYRDGSGADHGFRAEPNIISPIFSLLLD